MHNISDHAADRPNVLGATGLAQAGGAYARPTERSDIYAAAMGLAKAHARHLIEDTIQF
jgi:hypothetical protein